MVSYLAYVGDSSGKHYRFVGIYGDHGFVPVDNMLRAVARLFPSATQEAGMQVFTANTVIKTPLGYARVMTSADANGIVVVKDTRTKTVYALNVEGCTVPPPKPPRTVAELERDLRKAKRELVRQQAALVRRKSVARYQAQRIAEAKRSLQVAAEDLTGVKPLPNVPLTALARIVAEQGEQQRGLKVGDTVRYKGMTTPVGTVMDLTGNHIKIRPLERGTPTYWGTLYNYERVV